MPLMPAARLPRSGTAPFGWRWEGRQLVEDAHEQHVRWLILHMHRLGYSLARIAGELLTLNVPTRDGGQNWPRTTLHRVVSTARQLDELPRAGTG
jgi:hypothetical protein